MGFLLGIPRPLGIPDTAFPKVSMLLHTALASPASALCNTSAAKKRDKVTHYKWDLTTFYGDLMVI